MLIAEDISYVAVDLDVNVVMLGREQGFNVIYGDTRNEAVLREIGVNSRKTKAVVVALDNANNARDTVLTIRNIAPRVKIFARARNLADSKILLEEGVVEAQPETIESSFFLGYGLLSHLGISEKKIDDLLNEFRSNNYEMVDNTIADEK